MENMKKGSGVRAMDRWLQDVFCLEDVAQHCHFDDVRHTQTHTYTHTHTHTLVLPQPELTMWPPITGEPAGRRQQDGIPVGSGDSSLISHGQLHAPSVQ